MLLITDAVGSSLAPATPAMSGVRAIAPTQRKAHGTAVPAGSAFAASGADRTNDAADGDPAWRDPV